MKQTNMKKPDFGKRLLPLMDLIFLLLTFFIILPHGIRSRELMQIESLRQENQRIAEEAVEANKDVRRRLTTYQWQYGELPAEDRHYRSMLITLGNNNLYLGPGPERLQPIPPAEWSEKLKSAVRFGNVNFVIVQVRDGEGEPTEVGTLDALTRTLRRMEILYITTPVVVDGIKD